MQGRSTSSPRTEPVAIGSIQVVKGDDGEPQPGDVMLDAKHNVENGSNYYTLSTGMLLFMINDSTKYAYQGEVSLISL